MRLEPFSLTDEVDAEFVEVRPTSTPFPSPEAQPQPVQRLVRDPMRDVVDLSMNVSANPSLEIALYEKRARAIVLFIELPILALVAFNEKTPGLVRLGAGALAVWKATQLARGGANEADIVIREWAEQ